MNIFYLDQSPILAAQMACDKHVIKMILESAQILCSPFESGAPYRRSHFGHPVCKWARQNINNYEWLLRYSLWLAREYTHRYNKRHKSLDVILWCADNYYKLNLINKDFTEPPQCFGDFKEKCYTENNSVDGYRKYYKVAKSYFCKWTKREKPYWFNR